MINEELKKLIMPQLKLHLAEEHWKEIEVMFEEVYVIYENGQNIICLNPGSTQGDGYGEISLMFTELTGAYYDMGQWDYIKKVGRKL